jgi:hypothetical protein
MSEFTDWQVRVGAGLGFLAVERASSKYTRARVGMPIWQIYAVAAGTSLVTMTLMDQFYASKSPEDQTAFRKFHSMIFNFPEPFGFLPNPLGVVESLFESGKMIGESVNPFEQTLNPSQLFTALLTKFIAGPDVQD